MILTAIEERQCEEFLSTTVRSSHTFNAACLCGKFVLIMSVAADLQLGAFLATSLGTTKAFAFIGNPGVRKKRKREA